jgi:hypothetical protein
MQSGVAVMIDERTVGYQQRAFVIRFQRTTFGYSLRFENRKRH